MGRYAEKTQVSSGKSRLEIEKTLTRYGATGFMYGWQADEAVVAFMMNDRHIKFTLPMPSHEDQTIALTPSGRERDHDAVEIMWEKACRQRWRALALAIKAKLEAVESGITLFEEEFLAHIVLPDGKTTVGSFMLPQIADAYKTGGMPKLLTQQ